MSVFWKAFAGGFLGRLVSTIFIAFCALLGLGPDTLVKWIIQGLPSFIPPNLARAVFCFLGLWTFLVILRPLIDRILEKKFGFIFLSELVYGIKFLDGTHSIHSFGYTISRPHDLCLIGHIGIKILNTKNKKLTIKRAYLLSQQTGDTIDGEVDGHRSENLLVKENGLANIIFRLPNLSGHLAGNSIRGMTMGEFEKDFSYFDIVIETDRKNFKFEYNSKTTRAWVTNVQMGLMTPPPAEKPNVMPMGSSEALGAQ